MPRSLVETPSTSDVTDERAVEPSACPPVALRGHMDPTGYVPENVTWFELLTEPDPLGRVKADGTPMRTGVDPLSLSTELLTASGHPARRTCAVLSAYRNGMDYEPHEGPRVKTCKELRPAICLSCAENAAEVRRCAIINCPVWPYRMGRNPHDPRRGKPVANFATTERLRAAREAR